MRPSNIKSKMENTHEIAHSAHEEHAEEHIHMPSPSLSPILLAFGLTAAVFGIILGAVVLIIGIILTVVGLGTWIYDEVQNANAEQQH